MNNQLNIFGEVAETISPAIINVASVPQRSPFRYPGGKTWLVPIVRLWLKQEDRIIHRLIEPFAGGGIVSLTAAFEKLSHSILMVELDQEIAAVWEVIINGDHDWLAETILTFDFTLENIKAELDKSTNCINSAAFNTILKNRVFHGGILAKGSGMIKNGENGKGIYSRWYPKTLHNRIKAIGTIKDRLRFYTGDAFEMMEKYINHADTYFFVDPPYTIAGKRLYNLYSIDHERLFELVACLKGKFMLTYDDTPEIRNLANRNHLDYRTIPMKTTHHLEKNELIISDNFDWWPI